MKLKVQKFQIGGEFASLAVNYHPLSASTTAGAYAPAVASSEGRSSSKSSEKDELSIKDILKVFENVKGLAIDVDYVLNDFKRMFLTDTMTSFTGKPSISSLVSYYLSNIGKFNRLAQSKEAYDKVREDLIKTNSLDEIAVDRHGRVVVQNEDGELDTIPFNEYKNNTNYYYALTNRELLELRQTKIPFGDAIYGNMTGASMDTIVKKLNALAHSLGTTELKILGYTVKLSNDIKDGLNALQQAGGIKSTLLSKDLKTQAQLAIKALLLSLGPQELTLLKLHSSKGDPSELVSEIVLSRTSATQEKTELPINIPGTSSSSSSKSTAEKDEKDNPLTLMQELKGGDYLTMHWITKEGTLSMGTLGVHWSAIPKVKGDTSISNMLSLSGISGIVKNYEGITFGDLKVPVENLKDIMYNEGGGYVAILPATTDEFGNLKVDLTIMDKYSKIVNSIEAEKGSPQWLKELANALHLEGLDQYLMNSDTLDERRFGLFLMVSGTTTDRWNFKKDSKWVELVTPDKNLELRMSKALSLGKDTYKVDIDDWGLGWITEGHWDDIYRGTVYIPLTNNRNAAINAYGDSVSHNSGTMYERNYQDLLGKVQEAQGTSSDVLEE